MRIIIAEDDIKMGALLRRGLTADGAHVDVVGTGPTMIDRLQAARYDVVVLDVMLPGPDGFATCRRMREKGIWTPVLMLTARDAVADRVEGLEAGADDYLVKPFALAELKARLRALVRRPAAPTDASVLTVGDLQLDPDALSVRRAGSIIELSPTEMRVLELLMRNAGSVVTRDTLLDNAWDYGYEAQSNIVDVYVRHLRAKLDQPFGLRSIETVRGAGYRLRRDGGRS
ncbi:MAG: two component transcriptional regulator, winged helix family [Thermoleophilia bacterium]|nr:two component transcriptional regulator, winged helix family [Thermoleophilia bacterium]